MASHQHSDLIMPYRKSVNVSDKYTEILLSLTNGENHIVHGRVQQNLMVLKYLKSHAQVLLYRTGAPDYMWFLLQKLLSTPT
jgi:hypothetical protein